MPRLNGNLKWIIPVLVSVALGVWTIGSACWNRTGSRVAACEARLGQVERDSTRLETKIDGIVDTLDEIKRDLRELRRER